MAGFQSAVCEGTWDKEKIRILEQTLQNLKKEKNACTSQTTKVKYIQMKANTR